MKFVSFCSGGPPYTLRKLSRWVYTLQK